MFDYKEVEKLYPGAGGLMIPPQLIHKGTDSQLKTASESGEYFAQIKKDGSLYMFVKGNDAYQTYLFGRTVSKKTGLLTEKSANVPHIRDRLAAALPPQTVLLGEIYYPGGTSKNVTSIMGCLPEKAIERQKGEYGYIHYYVYDCLVYDGVNLINQSNLTRYKITEALYNKYIKEDDCIELAKIYTENLYEEVGKALTAGEEGMVFKKKIGLYEPGKRPTTMLKAKQVDYIDAIIIGFRDPTPQYTGKEITTWEYWVGTDDHEARLPIGCHYGNLCAIPVTKHYYYGWKNAIEIGAYDDEGKLHSIGTIASGLTDFMREDMSINPEKYFHKVVEIQCMMKDNKEKTLRHGFFLRIRDDKDAKDCKLKDIFS